MKKFKEYLKEGVDYFDIDPYGEEIWDEEELNPIFLIAKEQGKPYDQITKLNCSFRDLENLNGIENFSNLEHLDCSFNNLCRLEDIQDLTTLVTLYCEGNSILNDLSEIKNLYGLKILYCSFNRLTSLNGIENLINLKQLYCHENKFSKNYKKYLIDYCKSKKIDLSI